MAIESLGGPGLRTTQSHTVVGDNRKASLIPQKDGNNKTSAQVEQQRPIITFEDIRDIQPIAQNTAPTTQAPQDDQARANVDWAVATGWLGGSATIIATSAKVAALLSPPTVVAAFTLFTLGVVYTFMRAGVEAEKPAAERPAWVNTLSDVGAAIAYIPRAIGKLIKG